MFSLVYKEFKLAIHPFFLILPVITGALMLIPGWLYFLVLMYFTFITVPNVFANYKSNSDLMFSNLMPVRRKDIVASKIISIMTLELLHIIFAVIYAIINFNIYDTTHFLFILPNVAYFALAFIMYALFNIVLFPLYFKTGYYYGVATVLAISVITIFAAALEYTTFKNNTLKQFLHGSEGVMNHVWLLIIGIMIFIIFGILSYKISIKRFKKVDI